MTALSPDETTHGTYIVSLLAAALRGQPPRPLQLLSAGDQTAFFDAADRDGLAPLLRRTLKAQNAWRDLPDALRTGLDERARDESALEALRVREARRVLAAFRAAGLRSLLLKGTALAYTHYPAPYLRPRADMDILVREEERTSVERLLNSLAYQKASGISRDAVFTQWVFTRQEGLFKHVIDLHWAISNRQLFRTMMSFDELHADAVPVAPLGPGALTLTPVHALLLACIHRVAHHDDSDNLLWLYDVKLLAEGFSPAEWDRFWALARRRQLLVLCSDGLAKAARLVGCSASVHQAIRLAPTADPEDEPSAAYLGEAGTGFRGLTLDLQGAADIGARMRLVAGHLFPASAYMRETYQTTGNIELAAAYMRRAAAGIWRLLATGFSHRG